MGGEIGEKNVDASEGWRSRVYGDGVRFSVLDTVVPAAAAGLKLCSVGSSIGADMGSAGKVSKGEFE